MRHQTVKGLRIVVLTLVAAGLGGSRPAPLLARGDGVIGGSCTDPVVTVTTDRKFVTEGDAGSVSTGYSIQVDVGGDVNCLVTIDFETQDGTASGASDYKPIPSTSADRCSDGVIADGDLPIFGDTEIELDETFDLAVTSVVGVCSNTCGVCIADADGGVPSGRGVLGGPVAAAQVTIVNDDFPDLTIDDVQVEEGDSGTRNAVFTVRAEPFALQQAFFSFETLDGTATVADGDYQPQQGSTSIQPVPPYETTITVPIVGDTRHEGDETFSVEISGAEGGTIVDRTGLGTILDDDAEPSVSIDDVEVVEGDSGATEAVFTVTVSPLTQDVSLAFATRDGTATVANGDYEPDSGTLQFPFGGATTRTIAIPVRGDVRVEPDETFEVVLSGVDGANVAKGVGVATIVNDDASLVRLAFPEPVPESIGSATVTVERVGPSGEPARVTVTASSGTATAGTDFTAVTTEVSWAGNEAGTRTVDIPVLDDNLVEDDESIRVSLSAPVGATLGAPSTVDLVLLDDEQDGEVEIVGDAEPEGVVEREAELAVRVRSASGAPIEGAQVFWTVEDDAAQLGGGNPTVTGADGVSRQRVNLGEIPGIVIVRAALNAATPGAGGAAAQQESVAFELRVRGDLADGFDPESQPGQQSVGGVLDIACIEPEGQFEDFCEYLFGLDDEQEQEIVEEATPTEVAAQGNLMLELPQWGFREVGRRLAALRGGGSRRAEEELAVVTGGQEIRVASLYHAVTEALARQAAFEQVVDDALDVGDGAATPEADDPQPRMDEELDEPSRLGLFASGRIATADRDPTSREEGFEAGIEGLTVGVDYRLRSDFILGGAVGYLTTDLDLLADGGGLDADGYSLTAYGVWLGEVLYVEGVAGYGRTSFDLRRHVDLPVPFEGATRFVAKGDTDGTQWMANLGTGWETSFGASSLEIFGRASHVEADLDGYREQGGGPFNLAIQDQSLDSTLVEVGLDWGYAASVAWGVLQPVVRAAALHEFGDDGRLVRGTFIQDVQQLEFVVPTDAPDRDFFNLGVGLTVTTYGGRSFYVFYDTDLGRDDLEVGTFTLGVRLEL